MTSVDIMLPFYGDVSLMQLAVRSVVAQTDREWRLTVVDDGYPDDSIPGWFESLGDPRVRYFRNDRNLGANGNYRKCLTLVEHDLVVMMGADDVMLPNYVEWLRSTDAEFPTADIFQPGVHVIDEHGADVDGLVERAKRHYRPKGTGPRALTGQELAASLLRGDWLYFPSLAWRADRMLATGFRQGLDVVQDLALALDITMAGGTLVVDDQVAFNYRRHHASDSSVRALAGTRFVEERRYFRETARQMDQIGWKHSARVARWHLSSRAHAATCLPAATRSRNWGAFRSLLAHICT
jgi:glycosyltransferase involved in cell wall biosynthesis